MGIKNCGKIVKKSTRNYDPCYVNNSDSIYQMNSGRNYGLFDEHGHQIFKCQTDEGYGDGNYGW